MSNEDQTRIAVVITTKERGVFFGYILDDSNAPKSIKLVEARMCVYWTSSTKGVLGLASAGPQKGCRITDKVPIIEAWDITAVIAATPEATAAWEDAPWTS